MTDFVYFVTLSVRQFWVSVFNNISLNINNYNVTLADIVLAGIMLTAIITGIGILLNKG